MRVIICGGRDFNEAEVAWRGLDFLDRDMKILTVIEGGARGADRIGREWAVARNKNVITVCADWKTHGVAAGPLRNQRMLDEHEPDAVLFFPGGDGTRDMIRRAQDAGVKTIAMCVDVPAKTEATPETCGRCDLPFKTNGQFDYGPVCCCPPPYEYGPVFGPLSNSEERK